MSDIEMPLGGMASKTLSKIDCGAASIYADAIADVLCWFRGFRSAHLGREEQPQLPPGLHRLVDLKDDLQEAAGGIGKTITVLPQVVF